MQKIRLLLILCTCFLLAANAMPGEQISGTAFAAAKLPEIPDNADCAACHGINQVLPKSHVKTKEMSGKVCKTCHNPNTRNLAGKVPLSHQHLWNEVSCRSCHGNAKPPQALTTTQCFSCHKSYQEVAKLTKDRAINPHESHFGNMACGECHKAHGKSKMGCNKCHDFDHKVP